MFTKLEKERYNQDRQRACKRLNITKNQYNWLRRKGNELHRLYELNCNGVIHQDDYTANTISIENEVRNYFIKQKLYKLNKKVYFVYFQTDPRGATIYIDFEPLTQSNYTNGQVIY